MIDKTRFFVDFSSSKGRTESWTPTGMMFCGTLANMKKLAISHVSRMIDLSYGREDWSFVIYEADYGLVSDPNLYKYGVEEHGYVKGKEVFKFE